MGRQPSRNSDAEDLKPFRCERQKHLMVLHPLAAFHKAKISDHAVTSAAHSSQATAFENQHPSRMHSPAIPSILDANESPFDSVSFSKNEQGPGFYGRQSS